jgi:hypothetical protein
VLIWLRAAGRPLDAARRDLSRPSRLRWLAGGRHDGADWDAFLAPAGCPLADLVSDGGRLPWLQVRPLLEELADELIAADGEGTLPEVLAVSQVWVQPDGVVRLLDFPLPDPGAGPGEDPTATDKTAQQAGAPEDVGAGAMPPGDVGQQRGLALLGRMALLVLEGGPRPPSQPWAAPLRVPLPLHVARILNRLLGYPPSYDRLEAFRADLRKTRSRPGEVTRARRVGHLAALTWLLLLAACCLGALDYFIPFMAPLSDPFVHTIEHVWTGEDVVVRGDPVADGFPQPLMAVALPATWLIVAILVGFLARGGVSFFLAGLALVRTDGGLPSRARCAWRALLAWGPVTGLLLLAFGLDALLQRLGQQHSLSLWLSWLSWLSLRSAVGLLLLYVLVALWSPSRSWHDRLTGTCLVPR